MQDVNEMLARKMAELKRVQGEITALRNVLPLLVEAAETTSQHQITPTKKVVTVVRNIKLQV